MPKKLKSIIVVVIVIIIVIVGYFAFKGKTLKNDSTEVKTLYSYLGNNNLNVCSGLVLYSNKEVSKSDIEEKDKICNAYSLINDKNISTLRVEADNKKSICSINDNIIFAVDDKDANMCNVTKFSLETIKENYSNIYGESLNEAIDFSYDSRYICHSDNEYYYCGSLEEFTYTIGSEPKVYRSIDKVVDKDNTIEIYDYFIRVVNKECYKDYVTDEKNEKCSSKYNEGKMNYHFLKKYGTRYKHTFVKGDDGLFHWSKSEPIK